ncbi:MAG TPA: tetratricopeptide repeat protein [Terriglobales bacterium]|nr:tetratricopeptide repeat protein [Terriglobales bacterium]
MRRTLCLILLALTSAFAFAQSNSPQALYERGMDAITGVGPSRSDLQGIDYFRRSADLGYGPAQIALGYYYETGTVITGNQSQSLDLYRKAAAQGDPLASWFAGRRYFLGGGSPPDLDAAQKWLKPAAEQNNPFAAYYLGRIMADRDYNKAPVLYKIAADQGLPQAQYFYAKTLKDGRGIAQDRFNAYVWFTIALDAHYPAASTDLAEIDGGGFLTRAQLSEAKAKARELEQTVIRAVNSRGCSGWDGEFDEFPTVPPPKLQPYCH